MNASPQISNSRTRSLDAEINLVPFIDLLSMCICFLLITAVWIQIGALEIKQSHGTTSPQPNPALVDMDVRFTNANALLVTLKKQGKSIRQERISAENADVLAINLETRLKYLAEKFIKPGVKTAASAQWVTAATITPKAGVSYGTLVLVMDVLRRHNITNLGVIPVGGGRS